MQALKNNDVGMDIFIRTPQHILDNATTIGKIEIKDGNILRIKGGTVQLEPYSGLTIK